MADVEVRPPYEAGRQSLRQFPQRRVMPADAGIVSFKSMTKAKKLSVAVQMEVHAELTTQN